jgi:dolichol-phosphate mannosyltransferase
MTSRFVHDQGTSKQRKGRRPLKVAVVIPIWNEQENLPELSRRLQAALETACAATPGLDWQVIYVDDGSKDRSVELILEHNRREPRFSLVKLSRNFGHQPAISAGMAAALDAGADAAIIMDGDLQDPPELIPELVKAWRDGGQVVRAQRRSRAETGLRRVGFEAFHKFFGWISDYPIPAQAGVFGLMDRAALQSLSGLPEKNRFLPGLRSWIGFDQRNVEYDRQDRAAGEPKQTMKRLFKYALDAIFSFSYKPLRMMTYAGVIISVIGFLLAIYFILKRLMGVEHAETGFTTLVCLVLFLGGVQLIALGLLGEYLGRIYDEVKNRPAYIVAKRVGFDG